MNTYVLIIIGICALILLNYIHSTPQLWLTVSDVGKLFEFKRGLELPIGKEGSIGI